MLQSELLPSIASKAKERLHAVDTGYWPHEDEMFRYIGVKATKMHFLVPHVSGDRTRHTLCGMFRSSAEPEIVAQGPRADVVECGNCKRIYLSLVRRAFYGT